MFRLSKCVKFFKPFTIYYALPSRFYTTKFSFNSSVLSKLDSLHQRYNELTQKLNEGNLSHGEQRSLSKEYSKLTDIIEEKLKFDKAKELEKSLIQAINTEEDEELIQLAETDLQQVREELSNIEHRILDMMLVDEESDDDKNVILQVTPGTGGQEAALFANELFEMYERYCAQKQWKFDIISYHTENDGLREGIAVVRGHGAYKTLKFETGVHRVQRVPVTEKNGRVHTSACSVLVLPEAEEIDVKIEPKDLKIETMRSGGAGGQSVNKIERFLYTLRMNY